MRHVPVSWKRRIARALRWWYDVEPSARFLVYSRQPAIEPIAVVCVYRQRNSQVVLDLLHGAGPGAVIRLWALDEIAPELAQWTMGSGPGLRTELLNRCVADLPDDFRGTVAICDDDVAFTQGDLMLAADAARRAGLALSQPAHDRHSINSHRLNESRPWSQARVTTFVEVGPIVLVSDGFRDLVFPMEESFGMGSGLEIGWMQQTRRAPGFRFGIVDLTRMRHLGIPGAEYDIEGGLGPFRSGLEEMGGYRLALRTISTWRTWRPNPPW